MRAFLLTAAQTLQCDTTCVDSCVDFYVGFDEQAQCLDSCGCFFVGLTDPDTIFLASEPAAEMIKAKRSPIVWSLGELALWYLIMAVIALYLYKKIFMNKKSKWADLLPARKYQQEEAEKMYFLFKDE